MRHAGKRRKITGITCKHLDYLKVRLEYLTLALSHTRYRPAGMLSLYYPTICSLRLHELHIGSSELATDARDA